MRNRIFEGFRYWWAPAVLVMYLMPYILFRGEVRFLIHDYLDSNPVFYTVLARSGKIFASNDSVVEGLLGGVLRGCLPSELYILTLIYWLFGILLGSVINTVVIHVVAFFGMRWLLRELSMILHGVGQVNEFTLQALALTFALLPFWPPAGLSIAGQPVVVAVFIRLVRNRFRWSDALLMTLVLLYSRFIFSGLFLFFEIGILTLIYSIWKRNHLWSLWGALALSMIVSLAVEYRLILMEFVEGFQSQRGHDISHGGLNFFGFVGTSLNLFLKGQYHAHSDAFPLLLLLSMAVLIYNRSFRLGLILLAAAIVQFMLVSIHQLHDWSLMASWMGDNAFQLRFYTILPLFWHVVAGLSLFECSKSDNKAQKVLVVLVLGLIVSNRFLNVYVEDYNGSNYAENSVYSSILFPNGQGYSDMDRYYSPGVFDMIRKTRPEIGKARVGCLGFLPQCAQIAGFNTIGGYFAYYSSGYHDDVKSAISQELIKDKSRYNSFVNWGNKCYLYSHQLQTGESVITKLDFDFIKLGALGCEYLFCRKPISGIDELDFVADVRNPIKHQDIQHLYIYRLRLN